MRDAPYVVLITHAAEGPTQGNGDDDARGDQDRPTAPRHRPPGPPLPMRRPFGLPSCPVSRASSPPITTSACRSSTRRSPAPVRRRGAHGRCTTSGAVVALALTRAAARGVALTLRADRSSSPLRPPRSRSRPRTRRQAAARRSPRPPRSRPAQSRRAAASWSCSRSLSARYARGRTLGGPTREAALSGEADSPGRHGLASA